MPDGEDAKQPNEDTSHAVNHSSGAETANSGGTATEEYPPIDFNTFILSLSTSALMNLGVVADPLTGKNELNMPLARQTIDLLALLEEKTKGNLTGEEERLLSQVLYDLRMRFLAAQKGQSAS